LNFLPEMAIFLPEINLHLIFLSCYCQLVFLVTDVFRNKKEIGNSNTDFRNDIFEIPWRQLLKRGYQMTKGLCDEQHSKYLCIGSA